MIERNGFTANNRSGSTQDHKRQSKTNPVEQAGPRKIYRFFLVGGEGRMERPRNGRSRTHRAVDGEV